MTNYAVIFPGQGSQNIEMLDSYANVESFNSIINQASDILSYDIREVIKDKSKLNDTTFTQPVIVAVSVAMWNTWVDEKVSRPIFSAGHSLGEYSALVASGIISLNDCLLIVKERARMMIDAMKDRESSMAAVLGLESSKIISICEELTSPDSIIEAVNFNSDLQTVIAGDTHAIDKSLDLLKKAGANHKGLCPFHSEKTPSFNVSSAKQFYHCFGCGASGDAIKFLREHEGLSFVDAVEKLASMANMEVPKNNKINQEDMGLYEANKLALQFFINSLNKNKGAMDYLISRGIDTDMIKKFDIGYAADSWDSLKKYLYQNMKDGVIY